MPQSERSETIKELLKWIEAKTKQNGASRQEIIRHIHVEITGMGAEERRCEMYLKDCLTYKLIREERLKFVITEDGKTWLQRH